MIIVVCGLLAVLTVPLTGGDLRRMRSLPIRHAWAIWVTVVAQTALLWLPADTPAALAELAHIATYAVAGWFAWANRRLPGVWIMALGGALNLTAIVANGGVMPASPEAWTRAGFELPDPDDEFSNSTVVDDANVWFLGDVFAIPERWPFANVFSIGDVLIVIGIGWLAHSWCRREEEAPTTTNPPSDAAREAPATSRTRREEEAQRTTNPPSDLVPDLPEHEAVRRRDVPGE